MKKATLSFLLFTSLLSSETFVDPLSEISESIKDKYSYYSILSCDEVERKIAFLEIEIKRERCSYMGVLRGEIGVILTLPFAVLKASTCSDLEDRLKNLKSVKKEKCR